MAALDAPHIFINKYMQDKIAELSSTGIPFLPTLPTDVSQVGDIDVITESNGTVGGGDTIAVYDRMFKLRRQAFPHFKYEQLLYYFYSYGVDDLFKIQQQAQDLLDRGDESAQEINAWIKSVWVAKGKNYDPTNGREIVYFGSEAPEDTNDWFAVPFFHEVKVFQLEESRDIIDFGSARTWAGNKLIVDYCWHKS